MWLSPCDKIAQNRVLWLFFICPKCPFSTLELSPCDNYRPVPIFWPCPEVVIISDKHCTVLSCSRIRLSISNISWSTLFNFLPYRLTNPDDICILGGLILFGTILEDHFLYAPLRGPVCLCGCRKKGIKWRLVAGTHIQDTHSWLRF